MEKVRAHVPATMANLGPGFDVLGLALDLWNEAAFSIEGVGMRVEVEGEGKDDLPRGENNLIAQALMRIYIEVLADVPRGLAIKCENRIPLGSGMWSSCAAVVCGLLGGNALLGNVLSREEVFQLAAEMEGHADNVAAALYGGLTLVWKDAGNWAVHKVAVPPLTAIVVVPDVKLTTHDARGGLPDSYTQSDVVFNLSRSTLVVEALRTGNIELLASAMEDKLHQPYRLVLVPGAEKAIMAARELGAAAALSGAGPGVVAFAEDGVSGVAEAMQAAFVGEGVVARVFELAVVEDGAKVDGGG